MKQIFRRSTLAFIGLLSLVLPSCVAMKNTPIPDVSAVKGKSVVRVTRETPSLLAYTPGKAAAGAVFGAIGGAVAASAMISAGNEIVSKNQVPDPTVEVSKDLTTGLVKRHGMRNGGEIRLETAKPVEIAKAASASDYALDVRTVNWTFMYFPMQLGTYRVIYGAQFRLIECGTGKVIAEGYFHRDPHEDEHCYDYDQLVGNGAAGLKKESKIAGDSAKQHFRGLLKL